MKTEIIKQKNGVKIEKVSDGEWVVFSVQYLPFVSIPVFSATDAEEIFTELLNEKSKIAKRAFDSEK